jgi:hypothetical protein
MSQYEHHLNYADEVSRRRGLRKETGYETSFQCTGGVGILREEVWVSQEGKIVRCNLAFLLPHLSRVDKGRVLGFDNAHGVQERHFMGEVSPTQFRGSLATAKRFYREAEAMRRSYES